MTRHGSTRVLERVLTQADFDAFAALSGDNNPIHVAPDFAAATRFGRTVAHGALLCAILRSLAAQLKPEARQVSLQAMFPAPTYAGESLRFEARSRPIGDGRVSVECDCTRIADGVVTCRVQMVLER